MARLIGKVLVLLLICTFFGCMERESNPKKIRIGTYANKDGSEEIVFLDSTNYLHRYSLDGVVISDTSTYEFYSYGKDEVGTIELSEFITTGSILYPEIRRRKDGIYTLAYVPNYRYPIWSKSQIVIRSDLDDYNTILYLQTD